jgi:hypothetical protein
MNTTNCYTWKVFRFSNTFVGCVMASSQYEASILAKEKYGKYVWVERVAA